MTFKLNRVKATLLPIRLLREATEASGKRGDPKKVTVAEIALDIGGEETLPASLQSAIEKLWPGVHHQIEEVDGDDETAGFDQSARAKLPTAIVKLYGLPTKTDDEPFLTLSAVEVRSRPKLRVSEKAVAVLELRRITGRFDRDALLETLPYLGSDVWVTMEPEQVDMSEITEAEGRPTTRRRRPKQTDIEDGDDGAGAAV